VTNVARIEVTRGIGIFLVCAGRRESVGRERGQTVGAVHRCQASCAARSARTRNSVSCSGVCDRGSQGRSEYTVVPEASWHSKTDPALTPVPTKARARNERVMAVLARARRLARQSTEHCLGVMEISSSREERSPGTRGGLVNPSPSATRLSRCSRDPWLCVPRLLGVCHCREISRVRSNHPAASAETVARSMNGLTDAIATLESNDWFLKHPLWVMFSEGKVSANARGLRQGICHGGAPSLLHPRPCSKNSSSPAGDSLF
jgi:hypothetical protein